MDADEFAGRIRPAHGYCIADIYLAGYLQGRAWLPRLPESRDTARAAFWPAGLLSALWGLPLLLGARLKYRQAQHGRRQPARRCA